MLVLSRRVGEELLIDDKICIAVCRITPGQVKLGIVAPKGISIKRKEIITAEQRREEGHRKGEI